ncbi:MAG TPA: tetratricopeptide repeat protein [Kiritimatiellia bacterium]|mgnify:CR=1 FL=1|nr:tetratricopeptide repeat protein [Kiritimatiellia bacterium]
MDDHRDIYTKPAAKQEGGPALPAPEPTPDEIRGRTLRRTIWSVTLMVLLLGGAAFYFFIQEKKSDPMLDLLQPRTNQVSRDTPRVTPVASLPPSPVTDTGLESFSPTTPGSAAPALPPQKLNEVMTTLRQANEYMMNREWDEAEKLIRRALELWPDMNAALRMQGAIYLQRGQFDQAILTLEKAIKSDPFSADAFNNLATAYLQRGELERAEDLLLMALQIRPESGVTQTNLGLLYILWGRYDQAAEHLLAAVRTMPDNHSVRNNLGVALLRLGRYEESRTHFQHLINRQPDRPEAYFNMAITFVLERNPADAMTWLRQGVSRCSPVEAQRHLADSDFDAVRSLPEFQQLQRQLSDPRRASIPGV